MKSKAILFLLLFSIFYLNGAESFAQGIYSARGYWEESNKPIYKEIKTKQEMGEILSEDELEYMNNYEVYLNTYFDRLSETEKDRYYEMRATWESESNNIKLPTSAADPAEFEWRGRDRFVSIAYGFSYGLATVAVFEIDNVPAVGIPLIMGGLWALGPVINPKKFEDISRPVLRAGNTGRLLGWVYGGSLGLALAGESDSGGRVMAGLGALGSIGLGEWAFQKQKMENYSEGHIETLRHYGILGSWLAVSGLATFEVSNLNAYGAGILGGGILGLAIGNQQSKNYPYTLGDAENTTILSLIGTGLGFAIAVELLEESSSSAAFLIPAAGSILGTAFGHKAAKGVYLTKKQGSTIGYSTAGAALLGLGVVALAESGSGLAVIGVPSALALITQQVLFNKFKNENLNKNLSQSLSSKSGVDFSLDIKPENYFINQRMPVGPSNMGFNLNPSRPLISLNLKF